MNFLWMLVFFGFLGLFIYIWFFKPSDKDLEEYYKKEEEKR